MLLATKERIVFEVTVRFLEQTETVLHTQHAAYGIVNAAHRNFTLFYQLLQQDAEVPAIRVHAHIDTGVDGQLDGFLLTTGNVVAAIQVNDVSPVSYNHTVPVQVFLQPLGQQFIVGMERQAVVHGRVHHEREGTGFHHLHIGSEVLFAHILLGDGRRCTVFTRHRHTVAHEVFHTGSYVVITHMVGIFTLETQYGFATHFGIDISVFTVILPHARPTRITTQVDYRCIRPRNTSGTGFISRNTGTFTRQGAVKGSRHINALREECTAQGISSSVNLVNAIHTGDADFFHRLVLYAFDDTVPLLRGNGQSVGHIEDRAHFVLTYHAVQHGLINLEAFLSLNALDTHENLHHHLLVGHTFGEVELLIDAILLKHLFQSFHIRILGIHSCKRIGAFLKQVNSQLTHLPNLFFKGHFFQQCLYVLLDFLVTRNGGRDSSLRVGT